MIRDHLAYAAGRTLGGAVWKVHKDAELAVLRRGGLQPGREKHLNGTTLDAINRPSLLIADACTHARRFLTAQVPGRRPDARRAPRNARAGRQRAGSRRPRGQSAGAPAFAGRALGKQQLGAYFCSCFLTTSRTTPWSSRGRRVDGRLPGTELDPRPPQRRTRATGCATPWRSCGTCGRARGRSLASFGSPRGARARAVVAEPRRRPQEPGGARHPGSARAA